MVINFLIIIQGDNMKSKLHRIFGGTVVGIIFVALLVVLMKTNLDKDNKKIESHSNQQEMQKVENNIIEVKVDGKNIIDGSLFVRMEGCFEYSLNIDNFVEHSDNIVEAEIIDVCFVEVGNIPWTKITLQVNESIMGKLVNNEIVTVYEMGGYMSGDKFKMMYGAGRDINVTDECLVEMKYFQKNIHSVGEKGVFCLCERGETSIFPENTFALVSSSYSYFIYDNNNGKYLVREAEKEYYISLKELKCKMEQIIEQKPISIDVVQID